MRARQSGSGATGGRPTGYPGPSDRHPNYMYGRFTPGAPRGCVDDAFMLGLRDDAGTASLPAQPHHHPDLAAKSGDAFMFGVDPEQAPAAAPAEPAYYFWDVGSA